MKLAAVGFVVLLVVTAWAGYWVYSDSVAPAPVQTSPPLFSYSESGTYDYVAQLAPNDLYNSSEIGPGGGTLFTSITNWVNLTFAYEVRTSSATNLSSSLQWYVTLASDRWEKTLTSSNTSLSARDALGLTLTEEYSLNVSAVTALAGAIETETGYFPSAYSVLLTPLILSDASVGAHSLALSFVPSLNLTFANSQISPGNLTVLTSGDYGLPPIASTPDSIGPLTWAALPYWILGAALLLLGLTGFYTFRGTGPKALDIDAMMRPYREAIVDAPQPPASTDVVDVTTWEDVVKVADMLGRPILRVAPSDAPGAPSSTSFYVVMGTIAYRFSPGTPSTGVAVPTFATAKPARPRFGSPMAGRKFTSVPGKGFPSLLDVVEWTGLLSQLVKGMPRSPYRLLAQERILEIVELAKTGELIEAWVALGQLHALLGGPTPGE